jgi:hypothetical protein
MGNTYLKALVISGIIFCLFLCSSVFAKYSGGTGEPNDPYLIFTAEDMNQIGRNYTDWEKHFKLTADINLSDYTGTQFSRIGTDEKHAFSGVFDGNGHTISCFTYTAVSGNYVGVFGNISDAGRVENVSLVDVNVTGNNNVGGLVGCNNGTISNCNSTGTVSGSQDYVGGLVGYNYGGSITDCYATGTVSGSRDYVGGLVGENDGGSISNCYSTGTISGSGGVGGLAGVNWGGSISNCYSTGTITGGDYSDYLGGLVGDNYGIISDCYSTGSVTGGDYSYYLGGLVGSGDSGNISNCRSTGNVTGGDDSDYLGGLVGYLYYCDVTDCYAAGEVAGDYDVGGLVGMNDNSTITKCYSSGSVSGYIYVGGLLGWNYSGTTTDSFWDIETSGQSWSDGGMGKTTAEMKTKSTFTDAGWDFFTIWNIVEGQTYPFFFFERGTGTPDDPYRIATKADLLALAGRPTKYNRCFILTANIDMEGQVFTTAIIAADTSSSGGFQGTAFTGIFDGNDHKITDFTIDGGGGSFLGLFGKVDSSNLVKNLGLENCSVNGSSYVGGLAGYNSGGSISNCYSTGTVSGSNLVGGLVGFNEYSSISNCYSTGAVSGSSSYYVGGLVGYGYSGTISNCYSTGAVSGFDYVGGLMGFDDGSSVVNSFWDVNTSGQMTSAGGTDKTTAEMKTLSTFTSVGWDFVDETLNGEEDIWRMCDGSNYPKLAWQEIIPGDFICPDGVNIEDLCVFVEQWLESDCNSSNNYCGGTDMNYDSTVNFKDFAVLAEHWSEGI